MIDELLKFYYGFSSFSKEEKNEKTIIEENGKIFYLYKIKSRELVEEKYKLSLLVDYGDDFIYNCFGDVITTVNHESYVLCYPKFPKQVSLFSFYHVKEKKLLEWRKKWIEKSNYLENFLPSIRGKYPLIDESIPYYLGLMEMGIYFLKDYDKFIENLYVQHDTFTKEDYTNPFHLIVDVKERDFAEYLKYIFLNHSYLKTDIKSIIQKGRNIFDYELVIARLLLPNYYLNMVDDIILGKRKEQELESIITRTKEYEIYLETIINEIEKITKLKKYPFLQ